MNDKVRILLNSFKTQHCFSIQKWHRNDARHLALLIHISFGGEGAFLSYGVIAEDAQLKDLLSFLFYGYVRTWGRFNFCAQSLGLCFVCLPFSFHQKQQVFWQEGAVLRQQCSETSKLISSGTEMLRSNLDPSACLPMFPSVSGNPV